MVSKCCLSSLAKTPCTSLGHQQRNCPLYKLISSSRSQVIPGNSITRNKALSVKIQLKRGLMTRVARVKPSRDSACLPYGRQGARHEPEQHTAT